MTTTDSEPVSPATSFRTAFTRRLTSQPLQLCDLFPHIEASDGTANPNHEVYDPKMWESDHLAYDEACCMIDGPLLSNIRPHGIPLDTISEKSSYTNLPLRACHSQQTNRKVSAPLLFGSTLHKKQMTARSRSLDDLKVVRKRPASHDLLMSETSDPWADFDCALPAQPVTDPMERIKTPEGLPRWPADLPEHPQSNKRRTSAYVREMYQRLLGNQVDGADADRGQSSPEPGPASRIPVPIRLARGGRTGSGYWKPLPSGHTYRSPPDPQKALPRTPDPDATREVETRSPDENETPTQFLVGRLSKIFKRASRVFDYSSPTPAPISAMASPTPSSQRAYVESTTAMPCVFPAPEADDNDQALAKAEPSPAKSCTTSMLTPEPLVFRPRANRDPSSGAQDSPSRPISRSTRSSESRSSWDLPMTPLRWPSPPSPNVYSTPPAYRALRDDPTNDRSTTDGIPLSTSRASSARDYDRMTDARVLEQIRASDANSSTGSVKGQGLNSGVIAEPDVFITRPKLRVTNPSDEANHVHELDGSEIGSPPLTPIQMPSPLRPRPRFKPNSNYTLFPDTTSPEAKLPAFAPGMPIIRALRSVSSRLRSIGRGQHGPYSTENVLRQSPVRRRQGASLDHGTFLHPLEAIERRRSRASREEMRQRLKIEKRHARLRKVGMWIPTHCFCQPLDDGDSFRGPHPREARLVRIAERRRAVE